MPAQTLNILLVEDNEVDIMTVQRAFQKSGLASVLHVARDGIEGLAKLRGAELPTGGRLVLLDINMPRMNGLEFLRTLRADPSLQAIPVVMLTTSDEQRDRFDAYHLNVAGYLLKPTSFHRFVELTAILHRYWTLSEVL